MTSVSGVALLDFLEHRQTVPVGQPIVEQDQIDAVPALGERLGGGCGLDDAVPFALETVGQRPANELLVVDHENRWRRHLCQLS